MMTTDLSQAIEVMKRGELDFTPDYRHIVDAAFNRKPKRIPLYEHGISFNLMEKVLGESFAQLFNSRQESDLREFFRCFHEFWRRMGYDTVTWELGITSAMPGNGALGAHQPGAIHCRADFEAYPWETIEARYFEMWGDHFRICNEAIPEGMRLLGGCGNGVFESVQDIVGYESLCLIRHDDPALFADLFRSVGEVSIRIWKRFLSDYGDRYCVLRFGDDLGFKNMTLLSPEDIREHILPVYRRIISLVHDSGKPFLLHSCGNIFCVMDDLIEAGVNAKHSNEDLIASFEVWLERYGDRVGFFGGIDVDKLSRGTWVEIEAEMQKLLLMAKKGKGVALGSGNSIPDYIPVDNYLAMVAAVRRGRGDFG